MASLVTSAASSSEPCICQCDRYSASYSSIDTSLGACKDTIGETIFFSNQ
ncbi:MAG: hypothetical protein ACFCAD_14065 [Pleurocapsa sp.]